MQPEVCRRIIETLAVEYPNDSYMKRILSQTVGEIIQYELSQVPFPRPDEVILFNLREHLSTGFVGGKYEAIRSFASQNKCPTSLARIAIDRLISQIEQGVLDEDLDVRDP